MINLSKLKHSVKPFLFIKINNFCNYLATIIYYVKDMDAKIYIIGDNIFCIKNRLTSQLLLVYSEGECSM